MTPLLGFPCWGRDGARDRAILSCDRQSAWERRGRQPDGKPAGLARSPLYDAAELDGMEKKVESLFCGAHVEGRSTTVNDGQNRPGRRRVGAGGCCGQWTPGSVVERAG